jgi:flagellar hook assembly protein FlgD
MKFSLQQNHPNPFNPATMIEFSLPRKGQVELSIYNLLGQRVRVLMDESKPAGMYSAVWDGRDANGREVASGIYFYRLRAGENLATKKMLLLK